MLRRSTILTIFFCLLFAVGNLQAAPKGGNKGGGKDSTSSFVDGFQDSITPRLLCPWEQLNACEGRKEVFVRDETKRANGDQYFLESERSIAEADHTDVCMNEREAPTGITLWELSPKPIDLDAANGCTSPCNMLVLPAWTNRASCHENIRLDQSQNAAEIYGIDVLRAYIRPGDNFFCHLDFLPFGVTEQDCLASTSTYCHRGLETGETGAEYEDHLDTCLNSYWN